MPADIRKFMLITTRAMEYTGANVTDLMTALGDLDYNNQIYNPYIYSNVDGVLTLKLDTPDDHFSVVIRPGDWMVIPPYAHGCYGFQTIGAADLALQYVDLATLTNP